MDIKKIQEIVENSQMTDEAKDLIYKLLPDADKPEAKAEILKVISYEIDMNEAVADEAEEVLETLKNEDKMLDAVDDAALQRAQEFEKKTTEKLAKLDAEKQEVDKDMAALTASPAPVAETAPIQSTAEPVSQWSQPFVTEQSVTPAVPLAETPAGQ